MAWSARRDAFDHHHYGSLNNDAIISYLSAREIDSLWHLAVGGDIARQRAYDDAWRRQIGATRTIVGELQRSGLSPLIIKSGELVPAGYGAHSIGFIGDVDLLLPRTQMGEARRVLFGCGFRQAYFDATTGTLIDRDVAEIARVEAIHYELAPFLKVERFGPLDADVTAVVRERDRSPVRLAHDDALLILELDIHHNLAADVEAEGFFARAVPSHHGVGLTLSPADHLWIVLTRHYTETALHGKRSMRPFAYLLPLVANADLDWDVVERAAIELELGSTLYYYLAIIDRLVPQRVPPEILALVHPDRASRARDWGWQLAQVLGTVDPFPYSARRL